MFTLNDKQTYYIIPTNMYATAINEKQFMNLKGSKEWYIERP